MPSGSTLIDYVKEYGRYSLQEKPFNDVDSLALCQLSYLKFDGIVPDIYNRRRAVSLQEVAAHDLYEGLFADERFEKDNRALFEAMLQGVRFSGLRLNFYINLVEREWETQFAAVTMVMENGSPYIAFRGTDETIVGWKEDFNMAFLSPVPGQVISVKYLNMVLGRVRVPFYLGGHSKGGNLAVYAGMNAPPEVQENIIRIYSMDGPGFRPEVRERCGYEGIADKVVKILPHSSLVGMLFESDPGYQVVESRTLGLAQHNPYTWLVKEGDFVRVDDIYQGRKLFDNAINEWLLSLEENKLRTFVDTLYQVISASKAENLIEFTADWKKSMNSVIAALKEVDEQTKEMLKEVIGSLFTITGLHVKEGLSPRKKSKKKSKTEGNRR